MVGDAGISGPNVPRLVLEEFEHGGGYVTTPHLNMVADIVKGDAK